jgi:CubicO group peptidase (beta-lactamase class C family)
VEQRVRHLPLPFSLLPVLLVAVSCATSRPESATTVRSAAAASSGPWLQYADVRQAGFDGEALRAVCERADSLQSGAVMAVFRGRVILACGDVSRKFESYSVRKSLVSGLYGTAVARGEIDLDSTLADFSIDEETPLTAVERSATVRQVISARSGVYLPAAYGASQARRRPARGSHSPGTHWFYNNWDFNVAGVVYERAAREDLYESFDRRLAKPLGMEDWGPDDGFRAYEPTKSRHPAHTFRISTRDLARFGQLYLQEGKWAGRQILPADWVTESTRPHTDDGDGTGYGYMWWTYQAGSPFTAKYPMLGKYTFYRGWGTGEQGLWVVPGADLVVVHRADTDHGRRVDDEDQWRLVESVLAARRTEPKTETRPEPDLRPLQPTVLSSQLPPATIPEYRALPESVLNQYLGDYELESGPTSLRELKLTPGATVRVFLFDAKPYVHLPGAGDVQLFPTDRRDSFTVRIVQVLGMGIAFERERGANDEVTGVTLTLGDHTLRASRARPQ